MDPELHSAVVLQILGHSQDHDMPSSPATKPSDDQIPLKRKPEEQEHQDDDDDDDDEDVIARVKTILVAIEWVVFVIAAGLLICSLTLEKLRNSFIWDLEFWKWCVLALVILSGRLVSQWLIKLVVFSIEKNFMLKQYVLYFLFALRTSMGVFIWLILILLTWLLLFENGVKRSEDTSEVLHYITRTLVSCMIAAALWVVKNFTVKLIGVSFQCSQFFDPIKESIFHQFVLKTLSNSKPEDQKGKTAEGSFRKRILRRFVSGRSNAVVKIDADKVNKTRKEKVSAWTLKDLINTITEQSRKSKVKSTDDDQIQEKDYDEIKSESEAERFADKIFTDLAADPRCESVGEKQFHPILKKKRYVKHLMKQFQGVETSGNISKLDFKKWVVKVYHERETLKRSLNDSKTAIEELNRVMTVFVIVVIIIVWLLVMGLLTTKVLVIISSQLLLLAFVFGNASKTFFEAIIFVFVMHPFDVGDRCVIDGVQLIVEEMNILTTIFLRGDKEKIYYPNSVLATKAISNFRRSPPEMGDSVEFAIDVFTPVATIDGLKSSIARYLEKNETHWKRDHSVVVQDIEDVNKMKMALYVSHTMNFQEYGEKVKRRSGLVLELKQIFEALGIKYNLLPQEVRVSKL